MVHNQDFCCSQKPVQSPQDRNTCTLTPPQGWHKPPQALWTHPVCSSTNGVCLACTYKLSHCFHLLKDEWCWYMWWKRDAPETRIDQPLMQLAAGRGGERIGRLKRRLCVCVCVYQCSCMLSWNERRRKKKTLEDGGSFKSRIQTPAYIKVQRYYQPLRFL